MTIEAAQVVTFAIEQYVARGAQENVAASVVALRAAVARDRPPVRLVCSLFIPDDELCLHVLAAPSAERVAAAAEAAGITAERIVAATAWPGP